jgi:hypothetical protein
MSTVTVTPRAALNDKLSVKAIEMAILQLLLEVPEVSVVLADLSAVLAGQRGAGETSAVVQDQDVRLRGGWAGSWMTAGGLLTTQDGEGGLWVWDAASTETVDNVNVLASATQSTGRWHRATTPRPLMPDESITTAKLASVSVTSPKIAPLAIGSRELGEGAVVYDALGVEAVRAAHLRVDTFSFFPKFRDTGWVAVQSWFGGNYNGFWAHGLGGFQEKISFWFQLPYAVGGFEAGDAVKTESLISRTYSGLIIPPNIVVLGTAPLLALWQRDSNIIEYETIRDIFSDVNRVLLPYSEGNYTSNPALAPNGVKAVKVDLINATMRIIVRRT